jgi:hypothetical protein
MSQEEHREMRREIRQTASAGFKSTDPDLYVPLPLQHSWLDLLLFLVALALLLPLAAHWIRLSIIAIQGSM